jgi:hypothetical protein
MLRWADEFQKIHPGTVFKISSETVQKGMEDNLTQKADIGIV